MKHFKKKPELAFVVIPGVGRISDDRVLEGDQLAKFVPSLLVEVSPPPAPSVPPAVIALPPLPPPAPTPPVNVVDVGDLPPKEAERFVADVRASMEAAAPVPKPDEVIVTKDAVIEVFHNDPPPEDEKKPEKKEEKKPAPKPFSGKKSGKK